MSTSVRPDLPQVRTARQRFGRSRSRRTAMLKRRFPYSTRGEFERLENRLVLANIFWNVDADGFWDVPSNWKDESNVARVPGLNDDVFLDRGAGTFTVTSSGIATIQSL